MTQCKRVRLSGTVHVPLRPVDAFTLFTPTGERRWADGWEPAFPSPVPDDSEPGTVFETEHAGRRSTWTVSRRDSGRAIQYVTVTPGYRAGLITVTCEPAGDAATTAAVSYDLTALAPEANAELDQFAARYTSFLEEWQRAIARACAASGPRRA